MGPDVLKNLSVFSFRVTEDEGIMILHPTTQRHISEDLSAENKATHGNNICRSDKYRLRPKCSPYG
jgi:hypothetical protein